MNATDPIIRIENVYKFFGTLKALDNVSLSIDPGEKVVIIGPSGSGKSTLLRSINRLESIDRGTIVVDGKDVNAPHNDINAIRQELGMVFQSFNLFPHKTVLQNLTMAPMRLKKIPQATADKRAMSLLDKVGIPDKAEVYPAMLSGGQQQRVAIARALANQPRVLLMDEPFGALDAQTRAKMQSYLLQIWQNVDITIIFITHDLDEAVYLSDRILVLDNHPGRVKEMIEVPVEQPRSVKQHLNPEFLATKAHIEHLIHPHRDEEDRLPIIRLTQVNDDIL